MGKRGPKAQPPELRMLTGVHPEKINEDRPRTSGEAQRPAHLSEDAAWLWDRLVASFPPEMLTTADEPLFASFCEAWALHKEATQRVREGGAITVTANGNQIQNPWLAVMNRQAEIMAKLASRFGLSPSDRNGIRLPKPNKGAGKWKGLIG